MPWRGSTTTQDRILAFLPYLLPFLRAFTVGFVVLTVLPLNATSVAILSAIAQLILPLQNWVNNFTVSIILFLALYLLVVRNERIPHFIRFNTMQALLIEIALALFGYVGALLGFGQLGPINLVLSILSLVINLGVIGVVIFALVQCLRGIYAEIPTLSDAAYSQVR
jgi:Chloroplast import apparatus Tic20-like